MDHLFAPWRIEWVERTDETIEECVFCELPTRDADEDHRIVARSEHAYVMLNNSPYNPGHAMVVPHEHTGDYAALEADVLADHARLTQRTLRALETAMDPDGFNVGLNLGSAAAGGSIGDHVHTHVVPRWSGDTNFMPIIGDTKVIVEGLEDTYDRLHEAFCSGEHTGQTESGAVRVVL